MLRPALAAAAMWLAVAPATAFAYTVKSTSTGRIVRWNVAEVVLSLDVSLRDALPGEDARDALELAADAWSGLGGPDLVVDEDAAAGPYRTGDGIHGVYRLEPWPFDPELLAVTATTFEPVSGRIVDADILVNPGRRFALLEEGEPAEALAYDLAAVLTHEAGHVLGLDESPDDPDATMWPDIGLGDVHQRTIEDDDARGIAAVYLDAVLRPRSAIACAAVPGRGGPLGLLPVCALAAVGLIVRHRRRR